MVRLSLSTFTMISTGERSPVPRAFSNLLRSASWIREPRLLSSVQDDFGNLPEARRSAVEEPGLEFLEMDVLDMLVGGTGRVDARTGDAGSMAGAIMVGMTVGSSGGWGVLGVCS